MNADDMGEPVLARFYRSKNLSKAAPRHTTSLVDARCKERPANRALLLIARRLESFNSAGLADRQNQFLLRWHRPPCSQSFGLNDRQRQHGNRDRLMRQCENNRYLVQQRENTKRRLQRHDSREPPCAV